MAKEELEKEATEYAQKLGVKDFIAKPKEIVAYFGYLAGAEPREKRIAELEMTVGTLRTFSNEQAICIERLEKENAELKSRDCWKSCEYANPKSELIEQHIKDVQNLAKAKELLQTVLNKWKEERWILQSEKEVKQIENLMKQAEQFLKEIEK